MDNLYSTLLPSFEGALTPEITLFIEKLKNQGVYSSDKLFQVKDGVVGIPITITVSLPSKGTVNNIDIRKNEPLLIGVHTEFYPFVSPSVYSDRKDFPKSHLPHLYATSKGQVALCINRNDRNDWYAENTIEGFIIAIEEWFFKAGAGLLSTDGNEFDPTRLDAYIGIHAYRYNKLHDIVTNKQGVGPGLNFAILFGSICSNDEDGISLKSFEAIPILGLTQMLEIIDEVEKLNLSENPILSILCWSTTDQIVTEYDTQFPKSYDDFEKFCAKYSIDIPEILKFYFENKLQKRNGIPFIIALKRPKKIIGYDGDIEFLNFIVSGQNVRGSKIPKDASVKNQSHIEPFTSELANRISGRLNSGTIMFLGGGALGAKIYTHNLRAGNRTMTVVDKDIFLHHNLVRHTLHSNKLGKNKAIALIKEGKDYFEIEQANDLKAIPKDIVFLEKRDFDGHSIVIDTTASLNIQNWLALNENLNKKRLFRAEVVHKGELGLLYKEGPERNPRIDDLINYTYYLALQHSEIEAWRKHDFETEYENLPIGLGCSSTTTLIADDDISLHSAIFSKLINNSSSTEEGYIYLSKCTTDFPNTISNKYIPIKRFDIFTCENDKNWSVRIGSGIVEKIYAITSKAGRKEAAGVLVGVANYKTRVIHVFDSIDAPKDSIAGSSCFYRGIEKMPEKINEIKKRTGGLIGYIGEWHSHPFGPNELSNQDKSNIDKLKKINNKVPIPTLSIIVVNKKIIPFIFE